MIFLVDRSGSMDGSSIEQVRRALQLSLRSLKAGYRFDIVGFGSDFRSLFKESREYNQANLDEASRHVDSIDADMGGTEILSALTSVLYRPIKKGLLRRVLLLTDGEVSNEPEILELASNFAKTARIFLFGIGHGPSEHLVRGLAGVTGGAAEFIYPGERIEPKILRQFARVSRPAVTDLSFLWEGGKVILQSPLAALTLFDGEPHTAYALWESSGECRGHSRGAGLAESPCFGPRGGVEAPRILQMERCKMSVKDTPAI